MQTNLSDFLKEQTFLKKLERDERLKNKIKYKCTCNKIIDLVSLIKTRGKCPNCGEKLVEFNR